MVRIRPFADNDLVRVCAIQAKCPQAAQWLGWDYLQLAGSPGGMILVAEVEAQAPHEVVGFAAFHRVDDEAEVRNVAIDPARQRQGIARTLVAAGIRNLVELGVRRIFLEVRASNLPACELYVSVGFMLLSTRKKYYQNPDEDALVLALVRDGLS
jgi:ribosomal-protein-alanine acetyltransferase